MRNRFYTLGHMTILVGLPFAAPALLSAHEIPPPQIATNGSDPLPMSDPSDAEGWVLNEEVSDEFNGDAINHDKWAVQGLDGKYNGWKGRAPSQFVPENIIVKDGILKIRSKWEPNYEFFDGKLGDVQYGDPVAPVTTGAVIGKRRFLYGYMEARTKAANAAMTSAFWALGYQSELDVYEQMGNPKKGGDGIEADSLNTAIHDWRPGKFQTNGTPLNKVFNNKQRLPFRVADDFQVYGAEWGPDFLKIYVNGEMVHESSREDIGDGWVLTNPLQLYFDSEIFSWLGHPDASELPADYEIDYVRVWQKPSAELLQPAFFSFEGPYITYEKPADAIEVTKRNNQEEYWQNWYFHGPAAKHFSIAENEQFSGGKQALKLTLDGAMPAKKLTAFAPFGSVNTEPGDYILSVRVFVPAEAGRAVLQLALDDPWYETPQIDLSKFPRDQWVNLPIPITRAKPSGGKDRLRMFIINKGDDATGTYYFDDFSLVPAK